MNSEVTVTLLAACEFAQVAQDGKVSVMGIFTRLNAKSLPVKIPRFFMVAMLKGQPLSEHRVGFQILGPSAQDTAREYQASVRLGYDGQANVFNELTNTTLKEFGAHQLVINIDGQKQGAIDLMVENSDKDDILKNTKTRPN